MKAVQSTINSDIYSDSVFIIREVVQTYFSSEFHFHEECQLAYIIQGSGKRIVGDSVEHFEKDELVFIGSKVPHVWNDDRAVSIEKSKRQSISLSLFFSPEKIVNLLSFCGDIHRTEALLNKARRGMLVNGECKDKIVNLLKIAFSSHGIYRNIKLLEIIYLLETTTEFVFLASPNYVNRIPFRDNDRMNRVYHYLLENFKSEIQLKKVADIAGMNPQAFCRFFKSRTQKSLTYFVNEIRIGHACKLLSENEKSIAQNAYDSGFNNVSNFNHFFKLLKKISPRQFRKELCS